MPTYIAGYEIDAVLTEDNNVEAEVTDYPVESGGDITDHVRIKPRMVTLECVVSDTPVGDLAIRRGFTADAPTDFITSDVARNYLESLQSLRLPVVLHKTWTRSDGSLGSRTYDNMIIQSLGENITADTGDAYKFKVTFKQIKKVKNSRTTVKVAAPRCKKKSDRGNKPTKPAKPPTSAELRKSLYTRLVNWTADSFGATDQLDAIDAVR